MSADAGFPSAKEQKKRQKSRICKIHINLLGFAFRLAETEKIPVFVAEATDFCYNIV